MLSLAKKTSSYYTHMTENHTISIKCNMCDKTFKKSSDLDEHILATHDSMEKVNCEKCGKTFVETSRHQNIHTDQKRQKCHYFSNKKECPYEKIGCMFEHSFSENCKYGINCNKKLCSFQHNDINQKVQSKTKEMFKCKDCDFLGNTETELVKHIDAIHERWEFRDKFCDRFCRGDHGIHICFTNEDFLEYIGFDVWGTFETDESDCVFKCLKCNFTDDDSDKMRDHIEDKHKDEKRSKCNICNYQDKTWLGLMDHFRLNHYKKV